MIWVVIFEWLTTIMSMITIILEHVSCLQQDKKYVSEDLFFSRLKKFREHLQITCLKLNILYYNRNRVEDFSLLSQ